MTRTARTTQIPPPKKLTKTTPFYQNKKKGENKENHEKLSLLKGIIIHQVVYHSRFSITKTERDTYAISTNVLKE